MNHFRQVKRKTNQQIALEWDALAPLRDHQIRSGLDLTFNKVLTPEIMTLMRKKRYRRALDAGCGTGVLTEKLAHFCDKVDGVDLSAESINIARRNHAMKNINLHTASIESFAGNHGNYDLIVANMVLMDAMKLENVLDSISTMLKPDGEFIFSITHPWFWADYYGYSSQEWFSYEREIFIEGPFRISLDNAVSRNQKSQIYSTHAHRPLAEYYRAVTKSGMKMKAIAEPMPDPDTQRLYPRPWKGPRYLVAACGLA